jgi:hypothetical protein
MAKQLHSKQVALMESFTQQTVEINCTKCGKTGIQVDIDDYDAIKEFIRMGWRATQSNCYCPECATKHVKIEIEFPKPAWGGGMFGDD